MDAETSNGVSVKDPPSSQNSRILMKIKKWLRVDTVIVGVILVIVWGLLLLPIIFFYLPVSSSKNPTTSEETFNQTSCSGTIEYRGDSCREYLLSFANLCDNTTSKSVRVFRDASVQTSNLIVGFNLVGGAECIEAAIPFLCLFYFGGVCDRHGVKQVPNSEKCLSLSTGVCKREWALGVQSGFNLPDCESLPDSTAPPLTCAKTNRNNNSVTPAVEVPTSNSSTCPSTCRERFICEEVGPTSKMTCVPHCPVWNVFPFTASSVLDVLVGMTAFIGAIASAIVIVVSIIRRKKVLTFPSILVFYETISMLMLITFTILGILDRSDLYCSFPDLTRSIETATDFCILSAVLTISVPVQQNIWWVTHMVVLFWTIRFPFQAQSARATRNLRIAHIVSLLVGLLYPLLPIITTIVTNTLQQRSTITFGRLGFGITTFPPILCTGTNPHIVFYVTIFPSVLLMLVGTTTLVLMIWTVHRRHGIIKSLMSKSTITVSTAEVKLLLVFFHYIFLQVISFVYFTQTQMVGNKLLRELLAYFACESSGHDPDNPCSRSGFENLLDPGVAIIAFVLIMLVPVSSIVFVVDFRDVKNFISSAFRKIFPAMSKTKTSKADSNDVILKQATLHSTDNL